MNAPSLFLLVIFTLLHTACIQASDLEKKEYKEEKKTDIELEKLREAVKERDDQIKAMVAKNSGLLGAVTDSKK